MGLSNSKPIVYVGIFQGFFTVKATENTPGVVVRKTKDDKTVYELHYNELSGYITNVRKRENATYGEELSLSLIDGQDHYIIGFGKKSNFYSDVLLCLLNIDLSQKVTLKTWHKDTIKDNEKVRSYYLSIRQNDAIIKWAYEKGELPAWVELQANGETIWDKQEYFNVLWTNAMLFMDRNQHTIKNVIEAQKGKGATAGATHYQEDTSVVYEDENIDPPVPDSPDDDLPF